MLSIQLYVGLFKRNIHRQRKDIIGKLAQLLRHCGDCLSKYHEELEPFYWEFLYKKPDLFETFTIYFIQPLSKIRQFLFFFFLPIDTRSFVQRIKWKDW